jgi:hypothetical protein
MLVAARPRLSAGSGMIDPDAQRRAFDAVVESDCANAHATAAEETRESLRENMGWLRKELLVISSIAAELYSTLVSADPEWARFVSKSLLSQHERYQDDPHLPNVGDLLATISRLR